MPDVEKKHLLAQLQYEQQRDRSRRPPRGEGTRSAGRAPRSVANTDTDLSQSIPGLLPMDGHCVSPSISFYRTAVCGGLVRVGQRPPTASESATGASSSISAAAISRPPPDEPNGGTFNFVQTCWRSSVLDMSFNALPTIPCRLGSVHS